MAVEWGRTHQEIGGVRAIEIDEIAWRKRYKNLPLVYQIDSHCKRLLWIGEEQKTKTLLDFSRWFGTERSQDLRYVCSDMWKALLEGNRQESRSVRACAGQISKALDKVRAGEVKELKASG